MNKDAKVAVDILKNKLLSAPILSIPNWHGKPFQLYTDSSDDVIGIIITQEQDGVERVLLFDSKKLNKTQMSYDINKKEMLAFVFALERHKYLLWPRYFVFHTDNAALSYIKSLKQTKGILARWINIISSYNFDAYHKPGKNMTHVDYLSRFGSVNQEELPEEKDEELPINFNCIQDPNYPINMIRYGGIEDIDWKDAQDDDENLQIVRYWLTEGVIPTKEEQKHFNLELRRYSQVLDTLRVHPSGTLYIQKHENESNKLKDKNHYFQILK